VDLSGLKNKMLNQLIFGTIYGIPAVSFLLYKNKCYYEENITNLNYCYAKYKESDGGSYLSYRNNNDKVDKIDNYFEKKKLKLDQWFNHELSKQNDWLLRPFWKRFIFPPHPNYDAD